MRTLLAVDGSDQSYEAARALVHLGQADAVFVLHVVDVPAPAYPMMVPEVARELHASQERARRAEGERLLDTVMASLPPKTGPATKLMEIGTATEVILKLVEREHIGLIVMGARGVGAVRELVFGSVSHRIVTHAPCAVLVVSKPVRALHRVLLAVETQEDADAAVGFLSKQPFSKAGEVVVFTVLPYAHPAWPVGAMIPEPMQQEMASQATTLAESVAKAVSELGYSARGTAALGAPAHEILKAVRAERTDLILMRSHQRGLGRAMLGSVSHSVLHRMPCPVLIFR